MAQAFNFHKKAEKSLGNTVTVNFDVTGQGCDEENGSRLAGVVLLERLKDDKIAGEFGCL